jgi:hypothetical protein
MQKLSNSTLDSLTSYISEEIIPHYPEGFTLDPMTKNIPTFDKDEYCVSLEGYEGRFIPPIRPIDVQSWQKQNCKVVLSDHYVGGWLDHETNEYVLDISVSIKGLEEALTFASENNQKAIYWPHGGLSIHVKSKQKQSA